ncbi:MAG: FHA domain-containing protein [Alphaproteobacteria bacterium]|nr:FHA domain-containing protein [Alphaproteobacteria bacterium]
MGRVRIAERFEVPLRIRHRIGRSRAMDSRLREVEVSARHLSIAWDGRRWLVCDLGSVNGTLLNGEPLTPGEGVPLQRGAVLELGAAVQVVLVDDGPPVVAARCGELLLEGGPDALAIPSADDPDLVVQRDPGGGWVATTATTRTPVFDGARLTVGSRRWTLSLPDPLGDAEGEE